MSHRNVTGRGFLKAKVKANTDSPEKPNLRFHDLRHTFASMMIAGGADVVFLSKQLGHSNPSMTLDIYADLFDAREQSDKLRDSLEAGFGSMI